MDRFYFERNSTSNKRLFPIILIGLLSLACAFSVLSFHPQGSFLYDISNADESEFNEYMIQYDKSYPSSNEYLYRLSVFKANMAYIRSQNSKSKDWILGQNDFTDLTSQEFRSKYSAAHYSVSDKEISPVTINYPSVVDWATAGNYVTPVKNLGQCGACWAFSVTGAIESAWAIAGHPLVSLSEQQLIDCTPNNYGCNGGWVTTGFQYVIANGGITSETNYPYVGANQRCNIPATRNVAATIHSYAAVAQNNIDALATAVAKQPVSVLVDGYGPDWVYYKGGVVTDPHCGTNLDLAVLAVGYNFVSNPEYWLIKNEWGANWGEAGYIRLGVVAGNGICGVQMAPVFPIV